MDGVVVAPTRHRLNVDDFRRTAETGILGEDDRVELIDMAPIGQDHAATVNWLTQALVMPFGERTIVSVQNPVRLNRFDEPRQDVAMTLQRVLG